MRINVRDLADADYFTSAGRELVEHRIGVRWRRQIPAIACTDIAIRTIANERPRDHTTNVVFINQLSGDVAQRVQTLQAESLFMAGYLEHAVG